MSKEHEEATRNREVPQGQKQAVTAELLDIKAVASLLGGCSTRSVRRLADRGQMPAPIKLGNLLRWRRAELEEWLAEGCPPLRTPSGRA